MKLIHLRSQDQEKMDSSPKQDRHLVAIVEQTEKSLIEIDQRITQHLIQTTNNLKS